MRGHGLRRIATRNKMTLIAAVIGATGAAQAADYFYVAQALQHRPDPTVRMTARTLRRSVRAGSGETIAMTVVNTGGPIQQFGIDIYPDAKGRSFSATHGNIRIQGGCTLDTSDADFDRLNCGVLPSGRRSFLVKSTPGSGGEFMVVPDGHRGSAHAFLVNVHRNTSGQSAVLTDRVIR